MKDSWTWTTLWGLTMGVGAGWWRGVKRVKWNTCNSINNKTLNKQKYLVMKMLYLEFFHIHKAVLFPLKVTFLFQDSL